MISSLPQGFTSRPATLDDAEMIVDLSNTCTVALIGVPLYTVADLKTEWESPFFNVETDSQLVFAPDGALVGAIQIWDRKPHVRIYSQGYVHPDYQAIGIGSALANWAEARARQAIPHAPEGTAVVLVQGILTNDTAAQALLEKEGYQVARYFSRMLIEMEAPPQDLQIPSGIVIRPFIPEKELHALVEATRDAFRDHWGFVEHPIEEEYEDYRHWLENDPDTDPDLWLVAVDGDQVAATLICFPKTAEDPAMAYIDTLGVRRPWRKQGLGLALLQYTFKACYQRGKHKVALDVDSASLTGATRLYEKAGMHIQRQEASYEKPLRSGEDLSTRTLNEE